MLITEVMQKQNITKYRLSKSSHIPYTTISDICSGKAQLEKCSAETIYKIAKVLGVSMESLLAPCFEKRCSFELFKSNVCHRLKELGDTKFLIQTLENDDIRKYYNRKWYPESLYLLAMLDYVSADNQVPLCTRYDDIRKCRLQYTIYPASVLAAASVSGNDDVKKEACKEAIPEFMRFNIVESEVRNVI